MGDLRDDLVRRGDVMDELVKEYNRRWMEGGLKLAWIEKAVDSVRPVEVRENAIRKMPSAQPEIIRCKDCRHGVDYYHEGDCYCSNPKWGLTYFSGSWEFYCADAERRTDE